MAKQLPSEFTFYEFETEEEELQSHILSSSNIYKLRNLLAYAMTERSTLTYDVANPAAFIQREAELMGEIAAYRNMLNSHNDNLTTYIRTLQERNSSTPHSN